MKPPERCSGKYNEIYSKLFHVYSV